MTSFCLTVGEALVVIALSGRPGGTAVEEDTEAVRRGFPLEPRVSISARWANAVDQWTIHQLPHTRANAACLGLTQSELS